MVSGSNICDSELIFSYHDVLHISVSLASLWKYDFQKEPKILALLVSNNLEHNYI